MFDEGLGGIEVGRLIFLAVPLLMIIGTTSTLVAHLRAKAVSNGIMRRGQRVQGKVVTAYLGVTETREHRSTYMVETIEFTTLDGRTVRASPTQSDVGLTDRGGTYVTVVYDPEDPHRFLAPMNGQSLKRSSSGIGVPVYVLIFALVFLFFTQVVIEDTSVFGGL